MSQNRPEQKDRLRGEHNYKINLKTELEIRLSSEKIDHLLVKKVLPQQCCSNTKKKYIIFRPMYSVDKSSFSILSFSFFNL
ncbi:DUF1003 domain-containing protein [Chryseobacterium nematophagum]|uniref:DUF1003 domain-containing protein n=1 Tax=Chryseobacterium nematophagum TaxID=2305228 RepID=UPI001E4F11A5|nr:DUF1003 domain-containing protein [Chryseobacterium nematophagum]